MDSFSTLPCELLIQIVLNLDDLRDLDRLMRASEWFYKTFKFNWKVMLNGILSNQITHNIRSSTYGLICSNDPADKRRLKLFLDDPRDNFPLLHFQSDDLSEPYTSVAKTCSQMKGMDKAADQHIKRCVALRRCDLLQSPWGSHAITQREFDELVTHEREHERFLYLHSRMLHNRQDRDETNRAAYDG